MAKRDKKVDVSHLSSEEKTILIQMLQEKNNLLLEKHDRLLARFKDLESRSKKDSSNSSKPPSSDIGKKKRKSGKKRTSSFKKKSDKKAGGQPGHRGKVNLAFEKPLNKNKVDFLADILLNREAH